MSNLIKQKKKPTKPPLSSAQKIFNRLKKKLEGLQDKLEETHQELDQFVSYYHEQIYPQKSKCVTLLRQFTKLIYEFYKKPKCLPKKDHKLLKEFILDQINWIFEEANFDESDPEIRVIFEELNGKSYEDTVYEEIYNFKERVQEELKQEGIDIDFSSINETDQGDELKQKIFEALNEARAKMGQKEDPSNKPKDKKPSQKEIKEQELKSLQSKGLNTIYKQLAKVFHPDLEQVPQQKAEKEILMKKLTCAYENNDLHTLLSLEMEWMNRSEGEKRVQSEDQLKIYNSILKDQIENIQEEIEGAAFNPKYFVLRPYLGEIFFGGMMTLHHVFRSTKSRARDLEIFIRNLQGEEAKKTVLSILNDYKQENEDLEDFFF